MGLSATQLAVEMGARVIAIDIAPERRKLARQFGAAEVIDPTAHDMVAAIAELRWADRCALSRKGRGHERRAPCILAKRTPRILLGRPRESGDP